MWTDPPAGQRLSDINHVARLFTLGMCHKTLRVLEPIYVATVLFNPVLGRIFDLNKFIPLGKDWFKKAVKDADYRTTHKCIRNDVGKFVPTWLSDGQTMWDAVVDLFADRLARLESARGPENVPLA